MINLYYSCGLYCLLKNNHLNMLLHYLFMLINIIVIDCSYNIKSTFKKLVCAIICLIIAVNKLINNYWFGAITIKTCPAHFWIPSITPVYFLPMLSASNNA